MSNLNVRSATFVQAQGNRNKPEYKPLDIVNFQDYSKCMNGSMNTEFPSIVLSTPKDGMVDVLVLERGTPRVAQASTDRFYNGDLIDKKHGSLNIEA